MKYVDIVLFITNIINMSGILGLPFLLFSRKIGVVIKRGGLPPYLFVGQINMVV